MIALALDIGEVRVGIAVSDATGTLAMPVKVLPAQEVLGNARSFRYIIEDYELMCSFAAVLRPGGGGRPASPACRRGGGEDRARNRPSP